MMDDDCGWKMFLTSDRLRIYIHSSECRRVGRQRRDDDSLPFGPSGVPSIAGLKSKIRVLWFMVLSGLCRVVLVS